jgi:EAL domain-containing protein (putative c-di-GMP-specific phosphodiesterase class I)/DNA-binding NarL/FixJ family response regulator
VERSEIRVLLLDDDPFMIKLLGRMLQNLGCEQVIACDSGQAALRRIDTHAPDMILCDLNMPEMDGLEFVRHLVDRHYGGSLVLVSGEDERMLQTAEGLVRAHQLNLLGRLQKPVSLEALGALLDRWTPAQQARVRPDRKIYGPQELQRAIANDELVNHYQPVVDVGTGKVLGAETLVRWKHPSAGTVFPEQFIGVAEEHDLIDDLTAAVMRAALRQSSHWRSAGLPLRVSINVSMDNLGSLAFPDFVSGLAREMEVRPEDVVLEVTESRLAKDLRVPLEVLTRLRLKRFGLSIDDFGTGHSSLTSLHDFPFGELKVDRSFVNGAAGDATLRAIYEGSLGMARRLNMEVVAEGVEERSDWDFLRRTGCDLAQGYFIARPMPAEQLPGWIARWEARVRAEGLAPA